MAQNAIHFTLNQLTDCALMGPELGSVNFRLLNTILHVLIGQIGAGDLKIEFKGAECDLIQKFYDPSKIQGTGSVVDYSVMRGSSIVTKKGGVAMAEYQAGDFGSLVAEIEGLKTNFTQMTGGADGQSFYQRIEAVETGITQMATMIEDLAKASAHGETIATNAGNLRKSIDNGTGGQLAESVKDLDRRLTELEQKIAPTSKHAAAVDETFSKTDLSSMNVQDALKLIQDEFKNVRNTIQTLNVSEIQKQMQTLQSGGKSQAGAGGDMTEKMATIEQNFHQCLDQVKALDKMFSGNLETLTKQVRSIEIEMGSITEKISSVDDKGGASQAGMEDIYKKIEEIDKKHRDIAALTGELLEDKHEKLVHMAALKEQVEQLKGNKADRQEVDEKLAEKVDVVMINRKVSHEQFDATCMDLTKGIEDALQKLTQQEILWQQALSDIQTEIGSKLDKMELGPLKDFITDKLSILQTKMKALSKLKRDQEAAATKAALLKDVKCISCDQDVVMKKRPDTSMYPQTPTLPPTKTMAPYLSYELDQLRKQQKHLGISRNLHHFEQAKRGDTCNRYCGGSHTLTTPQQRVTRLGHFLEQWGPEISMVTDSEIKGKDGMIYKGEEKGDKVVIIPQEQIARTVRPSMVVHGDILSSRPGFEAPERLSEIRTPKTSGAGGSRTGIVTFVEPEATSDK